MKKIIAIISILFSAVAIISNAKAPQHTEIVTFKVYGNCNMCKKTIKTALKKNPAVKSANWNVETKIISVEYDPHSISLNEVHQLIANAGYDTEKVKASDAAYKKLPGCCQYERG